MTFELERIGIAGGKVVRDGKVAVLYSPGYGAGWSTWVHGDKRQESVFCPALVAWVEAGRPQLTDEQIQILIDHFGYTGGLRDLEIEWLPVNTLFVIDEYDGNESIQTNIEIPWLIA